MKAAYEKVAAAFKNEDNVSFRLSTSQTRFVPLVSDYLPNPLGNSASSLK